jgi:hypothetical protein
MKILINTYTMFRPFRYVEKKYMNEVSSVVIF